MSAASAPFGLIPAFHPSGIIRPKRGTIASGYATDIFMNNPVKIATDGTLQAAAAAQAFVGTFCGCEYIDATGLPVISNKWPASTVASNVVAWYTEDPEIQYKVQADGTLPSTSIGEGADFTNIGGVTLTGYGTATMSATTSTGGVKQLQVRDLFLGPDNAWGDAFVIAIVTISNHQFKATINNF